MVMAMYEFRFLRREEEFHRDGGDMKIRDEGKNFTGMEG
jgi:hypothetical protein